jgi:signal peptidase I
LELLILIGSIYALVNLATVRFIVQGPSMQPNFHDGDFLIVSRVNYLLGEPERGDIAVFHNPNQQEKDYIKRIIGIPGDTVEIKETFIYVNGVKLEEPYIKEPCSTNRCGDGTWLLGADEFFVMGDNRNHSEDSRSNAVGKVDRKYLVGEVVFRYWSTPQDGEAWNLAKFLQNWGIVTQIGYPGSP